MEISNNPGLSNDNVGEMTILSPFHSIYKRAFGLYKDNIVRSLLLILVAFAAIFLASLLSSSLSSSYQIAGEAIFIIVSLLGYQIFRLAYARSITENKGLIESYTFAVRNLHHYFVSNVFGFLTVFGGAPLILPMFYFYHSYFLTSYAVASEGKKGIEPAIRSREYVKNYWWQTFGCRITALVSIFLVFGLLNIFLARFEIFWLILSTIIIFGFAIPYFLTLDFILYEELKTKRPNLKSHKTRSESSLLPKIFAALGGTLFLALFVFTIVTTGESIAVTIISFLSFLTFFVF